jgi:hypothetical protein
MALLSIIAEIKDERARQDNKWGEQNHPDGTGSYFEFLNINFQELAEYARETCDRRHHSGEGTWSDILLEEVFEAMAEEDTKKLRKELVESAAVIVAWIEAIDRR